MHGYPLHLRRGRRCGPTWLTSVAAAPSSHGHLSAIAALRWPSMRWACTCHVTVGYLAACNYRRVVARSSFHYSNSRQTPAQVHSVQWPPPTAHVSPTKPIERHRPRRLLSLLVRVVLSRHNPVSYGATLVERRDIRKGRSRRTRRRRSTGTSSVRRSRTCTPCRPGGWREWIP